MNQKEVLDALRELGVFVEGHFVLLSRRHTSVYIDKDKLLPHIRLTSRFCREIASRFCSRGVETVIGPAVGGAIVARSVASHLSSMDESDVMAVYAEKSDENPSFAIRSSHRQFIAGKKVLVVEDVITLGSTVGKIVGLARREGGGVVGVGAIFNRGGDIPKIIVGVEDFYAVIDLNLGSWPEKKCPCCKEGMPVDIDLGHGKAFLAQKRA